MYAVQNAQISNQPNFGCLKSNKKIVDLMKLKRARGVYEEDIKKNAAHSVKSNLFSVLKDAIIETNAILVQFTKEFFQL